jgi:hypothetical protein
MDHWACLQEFKRENDQEPCTFLLSDEPKQEIQYVFVREFEEESIHFPQLIQCICSD